MKRVINIILFLLLSTAYVFSGTPKIKDDIFWQQVYDARSEYYEKYIGKLPNDILKMLNMNGVWPGGGIFVIRAKNLGKNIWIYSTFGMTNPDMPAKTKIVYKKLKIDDNNRVSKYSSTIKSKIQAKSPAGTAGYGYEIMLISKEHSEWPLGFIQWAVNEEIIHDVGILKRVEKYHGLTIQDIKVGKNKFINVLITKAIYPIPTSVNLPNGKMYLLVATVITDDEMKWSMKNGRQELLNKLIESGIGQISDINRKSIFK